MKKELIKTNYYEAVNGEWLENAVIPSDKPSMSAFLELHLGIEDILMDLNAKWEKDRSSLNENTKKFIKFYQMTKDFDKRNELGTKPFEIILNQINQLKGLKDLEKAFKDLTLSSIEMPFGFSVNQDFMNSNNQVLYFGAARLFLPDTSYYKDEKTKTQLIGLLTQTAKQLGTLYGFSNEEIEKVLGANLLRVWKQVEEIAESNR